VTVIEEEEEEQILESSLVEGEEHSIELLRNFSQEAEQKMTTALEPTKEEEAGSMDFAELYKELESLERRVIMQSIHIQQDELERDGEAYQPKE
jgi:hypothetical protein